MRCRAVPCSVLSVLITSFLPGLVGRSITQQYRGTPHLVCTPSIVEFREMLLGHQTSSIFQQRAKQCRAFPCTALRSGSEPCGAVVRLRWNTQHYVSRGVPGARYPYVCVYSFFSFLHLLSSPSVHRALFYFHFFAYYTHPANHTTQHRAIASAQAHVGIMNNK